MTYERTLKLANLLKLLMLSAAFSGCAETTLIRTSPEGASVSVNGQFIGRSPVTYAVRRADWTDKHEYHIELEGYQPREGQLEIETFPGRVTGTVFTLGILAIFKRPVSFKYPQHFELAPVLPLPASPSATSVPGVSPDGQRSVDGRLRELKQAFDDGLITDKEYQQRRQEILNEL